jgi:hypothetical protein
MTVQPSPAGDRLSLPTSGGKHIGISVGVWSRHQLLDPSFSFSRQRAEIAKCGGTVGALTG